MTDVKTRLKLFESIQGSEDMASVARPKPSVPQKPGNENNIQPKWQPMNVSTDDINKVRKNFNTPAAKTEPKSTPDSGTATPFKPALKPVAGRQFNVTPQPVKSSQPTEKPAAEKAAITPKLTWQQQRQQALQASKLPDGDKKDATSPLKEEKPAEESKPSVQSLISRSNSSVPSPSPSSRDDTDGEDQRGKFDFRALRNSQVVKTPAQGQEKPVPLASSHGNGQEKPAPLASSHANGQAVKELTSLLKPAITTGPTSPKIFPFNKDSPNLPAPRSPLNKENTTPELKRQRDEPVEERKSDNKKFRKILLLPTTSSPPEKPALPTDVDLSLIEKQYQESIKKLSGAEDETDSIYDDGTTQVEIRAGSANHRVSARVSEIPDLAAEDEGAIYDEGFTQKPILEEIYADGETEKQVDNADDLYEDGSSVPAASIEEDRKKKMKEEAEAKKREEKERKEKEKEEERRKKKEEKEKKERLKQLKKFGLDGTEKDVGKGIIKQDYKGSGQNLTVKAGQAVTILRLDKNPKNKWLIQTDSSIGYVESSNIEVDPSIIKKIMHSTFSRASLEQSLVKLVSRDSIVNAMDSCRTTSVTSDQPLYDDVPNDGSQDMVDDGEIYEECP
ncbi:FYN-binding protein 1-like isoform X2 [Physella acuta]|uniref:FYN-binding protein 1-like isoform X2 n=1 Tax=Physella acuta TaxID=109671 RepID=UPI0027DD444B|nr:FYN-binding protein 1-like isoform X2 [Physella acuta]XP_059172290.1 FYN-binding protein 1-like isoform X2 [Physella acuta]XP_059172291.1 FYN-binding protein 1-like isoform X2 [Physella acuta]